MQTLSLARFISIEYVIKGGDYNYISAHFSADIPEDAALFAKIQIDGTSAQWYVDDNKEYKPLSKASEEERVAVLQDLKVRKARVIKQLQDKVPYAESLFVIPSEDQIFYTKSGGTPRALLCQWGFKKRNDVAKDDTISFLLAAVPDPPAQVDVRFVAKGSDGEIMGNTPFKLEWVGKDFQDIITDESGSFPLGSMMPGSHFSIIDETGQRYPFTVEAGVEEYSAVIPVYASVAVRAVNQENNPKAGYRLFVNGVDTVTDSEGFYRGDKILVTPGATLDVSDEKGCRESYSLVRGDNAFSFQVTDHFLCTLIIRSQWDDGEPIPEFLVNVNGNEMISDQNGRIELPGLDVGELYTVYPCDNLADKQEIRLVKGENEVLLQKTKIPPKKVRVRLFDHKGKPLAKLHVRFKLAKGPYEADTDENGCIFIPEDVFVDREKVQFSFEYESPDEKKLK